ncbi:MAG: hypothetical protein BWY92_01964 [Firmicutes bacterium ADurb.BinA052]|nr:MAG: hypothetical protein BWY92_01964 [Firmicutes bacterium ADurb.BinA052]
MLSSTVTSGKSTPLIVLKLSARTITITTTANGKSLNRSSVRYSSAALLRKGEPDRWKVMSPRCSSITVRIWPDTAPASTPCASCAKDRT